MAYFAAFTISTLLALFSEGIYKQCPSRAGRRLNGWIVFACFAVISVTVLNWVRDYSIGTDVLYYGNKTFTMSYMTNSFLEYFNYCEHYIGMHEIGYAFLNYAVSRFSHSAHDLYLVIGLITNGFAYATACRCRKFCPVPLAWLTYLLVFYPTSLNMLRQSLAIVILAYAFCGIGKIGWKRYLIWVAVAFTMHQSAVCGVALLPLYTLLKKCENEQGDGMSEAKRALAISVAFISVVAVFSTAFGVLSDLGVLPAKYDQYLEASSEDKSLTNPILIRLPFVLLAVWLILRYRERIGALELCLAVFILCEFSLLPLQNVSVAAFRISLYFGIFKIVAYPMLLYRLDIPKWMSVPLFLAYIVFIFVFQIVISGNGEVYPFLMASDIFR